jgi:hypothetical protein
MGNKEKIKYILYLKTSCISLANIMISSGILPPKSMFSHTMWPQICTTITDSGYGLDVVCPPRVPVLETCSPEW